MRAPSPAEEGLEPGRSLGQFRLDEVVGEGTVGIVFRAERLSDGTTVALKVLKKALSGDDVFRRRFTREARVAQAVRHDHLVPVLDAGEVDGYHYLASAYFAGGSLRDRLEAKGALEVGDCVRLTTEAAAGLDALHEHGIVHRDVKSANVMLDEGDRAAVTDFGLAKGRAYTVLTRPGQVMGTLGYLAPEVINGREPAAASDIYALGCLTYELLTGAVPFAERRAIELAVAHLQEEPADPREKRPELPPTIGEVLRYALAKDPSERPRTGTAFALLLRAASGLPLTR